MVIYEYEIDLDNVVRFESSEYKNVEYLGIRKYYKGYPTRKGITFPLNEFPEFTNGLIKFKEYIESKRNKNTVEND